MLGAFLTGCASPLPAPLQSDPPDAPTLQQVLASPERHVGQSVRWGGVIIRIETQSDSSLIEVLAKPLDNQGRPLTVSDATGRFLSRVTGFLDPLVFQREREVTVSGRLGHSQTRTVGDYPYRYPVVEVDSWHLWEPRPTYRTEPPYWYDPWYPWGYPYPWWRDRPPF